MTKKILAVIPARGGSKGLPRKNIRDLAGKPLIAWTIECAKRCPKIDRIIVSTDDQEIADVAKSYGADVPFLRPAKFATDESAGIDPVLHAIEQLTGYEYLVLLQPTSPLRHVDDINAGVRLCLNENFTSCVSVVEASTNPYSCFSITEKKCIAPVIATSEKYVRRQDMPNFYCLNGAFYMATVEFLKSNKTFVGEQTGCFIMPRNRSIDIDDIFDFEYAEFLMTKNSHSLLT